MGRRRVVVPSFVQTAVDTVLVALFFMAVSGVVWAVDVLFRKVTEKMAKNKGEKNEKNNN